MEIHLGCDDYLLSKKNEAHRVTCDYAQLVNAHALVMGKTGMGKTTLLHRFISQLARQGVRVHVFDVHGDMDIPGSSSFRFSESAGYGLNPFVLGCDPHFGGVRKRVQDFIATIGASNPVGPRQEAVMRHLINDLYAANGFYPEKPASWSLNDTEGRRYPKRYPSMEDACRFTFAKLKQLVLGSGTQSGKALEELNAVTSRIHRLAKLNAAGKGAPTPDDAAKLEKLKSQAIELYTEHVNHLETGRELADFIRYESKGVLRSVLDRFDNLKASGIFKESRPPFDPATPVWRYDITALRDDEKRMFVEFRLQEIFAASQERGVIAPENGGHLRDIMVVDEAHLFFRDDDNNILNTIAKEGRKFGLGLVCASQSPTHFSEDFFANVATKVILGIDQMYWDNLVRKMKVNLKSLEYVQPFRVMGVQMNRKGETKSRFLMVRMPEQNGPL